MTSVTCSIKGWDLTTPDGVWSVLLWAAANGRVAAVLSSPPYRTWCTHETLDNRRSDSDVWGSPEPGTAAYKENILAIQDMFLWSLSSVARNGAVPYLRELPSTGQDPAAMPIHGVTPDAFWNTEAWKAFRLSGAGQILRPFDSIKVPWDKRGYNPRFWELICHSDISRGCPRRDPRILL